MSDTKADGYLNFGVNGHALRGEMRNGRWAFVCPDFPDLAQKYSGVGDSSGIVGEFMARAMAGAVTLKRIVEALG